MAPAATGTAPIADDNWLRAVFEHARDGLALADIGNKQFTDANPAFCRMTGYTLDDIRRLSVRDLHPPDALERVIEQFEQQAAGLLAIAADVPLLRKDGSVLYTEISSAPVTVAGRTCLLGIFRDITERKQAEAEAQKLAEVVRRSSELVNLATLDGRMVFLNDAGSRMLGIEPGEAGNHFIQEVIPEPRLPLVRGNLLPTLQAGDTWEGELQYRNLRTGVLTDVHAIAFVIKQPGNGAPRYLANISRDVTEYKRAQEALRVSEERYRTATELLSDYIFRARVEADGKAVIESVSGNFERITGRRLSDVAQSDDWFRTIHPDDAPRVGQALAALIRSGGTQQFEFRTIVIREGKSVDRWVEVRTKAETDPATGKTAAIVGAVRDITDRKHADLARRESEERLRATLASITDPVFVLDREGRFVGCHAPDDDLLYQSPALFIGKLFREVLPPAVAEPLAKALDLVRASGQRQRLDYEMEIHGERTCWSANVAPRVDNTGQFDGVTILARDMTERVHMEARLRQAEKLTAIGQLAGGVAHDFNNQLGIIMACADMLAAAVDKAELKSYAKDIVDTAHRAADLTHKLLAFSRKGKIMTAPVDVHHLLDEIGTMLRRSIDKRIRIVQRHRAERAVVLGDATQLQNALLNLALNARDAMPEGGELALETECVTVGAEECRRSPHEIVPGLYLAISVTDSGCGMTDEVKKHLFEPFFTTKKPGAGTGMGLAGVYGTIRSHHGAVTVTSAVGRGTTVRLCLPLTAEAATARHESKAAPALGGTAHVLIVEDEGVLRNMVAAMLRDLGYHVTACADGREAVTCYRDHWHEIDLVILDMIMPVMGGRETFLALRQINPRVRALLSSGYSVDGETQAILKDGVLGFIGKPYRLADLARAVTAALPPP